MGVKLLNTTIAFAVGVTASIACAAQQTTDIEYAKPNGESLKLDVSVPDGPGPFPVVLYVHGGGWASGDKQADTPLLKPLMAAGVATVISIDYRLAPKYRWPACFDDVNTAIRWAKAHAAEYRGDPNRIALMGYSAGGQLACLAAVTATPDTAVQAVIGVSPPTDLELDLPQRHGLSKSLQDLLNRPQQVDDDARKQVHEMSAINHIKPGLPPFLILHGTVDKSVPFAGTTALAEKLKAAGVPCEVVTITGGEHRLRDWPRRHPGFEKELTDWIVKTLPAPATQPSVKLQK